MYEDQYGEFICGYWGSGLIGFDCTAEIFVWERGLPCSSLFFLKQSLRGKSPTVRQNDFPYSLR